MTLFERSAVWHFFLSRVRILYREPGGWLHNFILPVATTLFIAFAFQPGGADQVDVGVIENGPAASALLGALGGEQTVHVVTVKSDDEGMELLRRRKVALFVHPGDEPTLVYDTSRDDGLSAQLIVKAAVERLAGAQDHVTLRMRPVPPPVGSRYVDFLVPGMLAFTMMTSSLGVAFTLVEMRMAKLLKRFLATPMHVRSLIFGFVLALAAQAGALILLFSLVARLTMGVKLFGNPLLYFAFAVLGSASFAAIGILLASRATAYNMVGGLMGILNPPMVILGGVFFSADRFPQWAQPVLKLLPLRAYTDGLRAIAIDGVHLPALWPQAAVLVGWALICGVIGGRIFRWF